VVKELIDSPILHAKGYSSCADTNSSNHETETATWTFYHICTIKGCVSVNQMVIMVQKQKFYGKKIKCFYS